MSKEQQVTQLTDNMAKFIAHIAKKLPDDVIEKLTELREKEDSPLSKVIYDTCERQETCGQLQDCSGDDREYGRKRIPGSGYADDKGQTDSGSEL